MRYLCSQCGEGRTEDFTCRSGGVSIPDVEILSDGFVVWVNGAHGGAIGRFGWNGIDVHTAAGTVLVIPAYAAV